MGFDKLYKLLFFFLINYYNSHNIPKLYSEFPNSSKIFSKYQYKTNLKIKIRVIKENLYILGWETDWK